MPRVAQNEAEVGIYTFGKLTEHPPNWTYLIDVAGLRDPSSNRGFRKTYSDGRPGEIQTYMRDDPRVPAIIDTIKMITWMNLRSEARDNRWLSFGLRDHHGIWIAPPIGEIVADSLSNLGFKVSLFHHELTIQACKVEAMKRTSGWKIDL
jgi:hypothetical protein